jgi:hypothetical protein
LKPAHREPALLALTAGLLGLTAAITIVFMALPPEAGRHVLGATWPQAHTLVLTIGVQTACLAISYVAFLALRLIAPRSTLRPRLISAAVLVPSFFLGYFVAGVTGAVWGLTVSCAVQAILSVFVYLQFRSRGRGVSEASPDLVKVG